MGEKLLHMVEEQYKLGEKPLEIRVKWPMVGKNPLEDEEYQSVHNRIAYLLAPESKMSPEEKL